MSLRVNQPSFAAGELAPALYGRVDLAKFHVGLRLARNLFVRPHGGLVNRPGTRFVCEAADSAVASRLVPFGFSTSQAYVLEFGHRVMRVILDRGLALEAPQAVVAVSREEAALVTVPDHGYQEGDEVFLTGAGRSLSDEVLVVRQATAEAFRLSTKASAAALSSLDGEPYPGGGSVARVYRRETPYEAQDLPELQWIQSADVMYLVHPDHPIRKLSRSGHTAWSLTEVDFLPGIAAPAGLSVEASVAEEGEPVSYAYKVTAIAEASGEESLPSAAVTVENDLSLAGNSNRVSWSAVAGAGRYEVYKDDNGLFGFIGGTEGTAFVDRNVTADLASTPPKAANPFAAAGARPSTATFFEQRLVFAASREKPQTLWFSGTANFENFGTRAIAQADDAVTVTLVARQVNAIRHLVAKEDLWALTSGGAWRIRGGGDVDFITPSGVTTRKVSAWGASAVPPLEIGTSLLFVLDKGQGVRDLFNQVALPDFEVEEGSDLSILAPHLFEGRRVKAWAYAQVPHSLVWTVMDDGALLSLCYYREHRVYAWTRHQTESLEADDGFFEEVTAIGEAGEDLPYFLVRRQVEGRLRRCIECLPQRRGERVEEAFFLDSGLSYEGRPAARFHGLRHLEGRAVTALADGNVVRGLRVAGGAVTLPAPASKVHIGLPYDSALRTLPLELQLRDGLSAGRTKRLLRVAVKLSRSRGLWAGPDETRLTEHRQRAAEPWGAPVALADGDVEIDAPAEWAREADLWIVQKDPLPLEILAVTPVYALGS